MFATRLLAVALLRSTRPTFHTTYQHHFPRYQRSFSASSTSRSKPTPDSLTEFTTKLQKTSVGKKLAGHPDAIAAIKDMGLFLQKSGKCLHFHHCLPMLIHCVMYRYRPDSGYTFTPHIDETCYQYRVQSERGAGERRNEEGWCRLDITSAFCWLLTIVI